MNKEKLIKLFEDETGNHPTLVYQMFEKKYWERVSDWLIEHHKTEIAKKDDEIERLKKHSDWLSDGWEESNRKALANSSAHDKLKARIDGAPRTTFELGTKIDINNHYTYFKGSKTVALVELGQDDSCDTSGE